MRRLLTVAAATIAASGVLAACDLGGTLSAGATYAQQAQGLEAKAQGSDSLHFDRLQPVPQFQGPSQVRSILIDIEKWQVEGASATFFFMTNNGIAFSSCAGVGAPVASDTQLTNPYQAVWNSGANGADDGGAGVPTGNEDPNGTYPGVSSGTWVMCVNPTDGQTYPKYWEGLVYMDGAPAKWSVPFGQPGGHDVILGQGPSIFSNVK